MWEAARAADGLNKGALLIALRCAMLLEDWASIERRTGDFAGFSHDLQAASAM
jgi:hypothetical protein